LSIFQQLRVATLFGLLAWAGLPPPAARAADWESDFQWGSQSTRSDSLDADAPAWSTDLRLSRWPLAGLDGDFDFFARRDLYDRVAGVRLGLSGRSPLLAGHVDFGLSTWAPGELSLPILRFDPDALLLVEERQQSSRTLDMDASLDWIGEALSMRFGIDASRLDYPAPDSVTSDRDEGKLSATLEYPLPGALDLTLATVLNLEGYRQRSSSNRRDAIEKLGLSRFLGDRWSLQSSFEFENQAVSEAAGLISYERPGGSLWRVDYGAERLGTSGDFSVRARWSRENWDDYDGYYRPGYSWESEATLASPSRGDTRMEILAGASGFDPDSPSDDAWTIARSRERILEGTLQLEFLAQSSLPLQWTLIAEDDRFGSDGGDRFRTLQSQLDLRWIWGRSGSLDLRVGLDDYQSAYEGEAGQRDQGYSGRILLEWKLPADWSLSAQADRSRRYSFLETGERTDDWEMSLALRRRREREPRP